LWGIGIGAILGVFVYICADLTPKKRPASILGRMKRFLLCNPISTWLQIRDGWDVWADGGREGEWIRWKAEWERQRLVEDNRSR
jgi:dolichyldiphosphatase